MKTSAALVLYSGPLLAAETSDLTAPQALDRLKSLVGTWEGPIGTPDGPRMSVRYVLTGGGHTVVETLFPGTDHEMMTVYHLDGATLLAQHYCSGGNAPVMRLEKATARELAFGFAGRGANLDPAKDSYIHSGRIRWTDAGTLESEWDFYSGAEPKGTHKFLLARTP